MAFWLDMTCSEAGHRPVWSYVLRGSYVRYRDIRVALVLERRWHILCLSKHRCLWTRPGYKFTLQTSQQSQNVQNGPLSHVLNGLVSFRIYRTTPKSAINSYDVTASFRLIYKRTPKSLSHGLNGLVSRKGIRNVTVPDNQFRNKLFHLLSDRNSEQNSPK